MRLLLSALALAALGMAGGSAAQAQVHVDGYYRGNGTYVQPHVRTYPDSSPYNNYGYRRNSYIPTAPLGQPISPYNPN